MEIAVSGRKMPVSEKMHDYAVEKIGRVLRPFEDDVIAAHIMLYTEKNPANPKQNVCEVTVDVIKGNLVRVEESEEDMFAAIDVAASKIARQMRKYKTRNLSKRIKANEKVAAYTREDGKEDVPLDVDALMDELSTEDDIVRTKDLDLKPMTTEEALVQMDLLGHDFFAYIDRDTNAFCVMYRRKDGGYGILKQKEE